MPGPSRLIPQKSIPPLRVSFRSIPPLLAHLFMMTLTFYHLHHRYILLFHFLLPSRPFPASSSLSVLLLLGPSWTLLPRPGPYCPGVVTSPTPVPGGHAIPRGTYLMPWGTHPTPRPPVPRPGAHLAPSTPKLGGG